MYSSTSPRITSSRPIRIQLSIDRQEVNFQLETSSSVTLISEQVWNTIGRPALQPSIMDLNRLTSHAIR